MSCKISEPSLLYFNTACTQQCTYIHVVQVEIHTPGNQFLLVIVGTRAAGEEVLSGAATSGKSAKAVTARAATAVSAATAMAGEGSAQKVAAPVGLTISTGP